MPMSDEDRQEVKDLIASTIAGMADEAATGAALDAETAGDAAEVVASLPDSTAAEVDAAEEDAADAHEAAADAAEAAADAHEAAADGDLSAVVDAVADAVEAAEEAAEATGDAIDVVDDTTETDLAPEVLEDQTTDPDPVEAEIGAVVDAVDEAPVRRHFWYTPLWGKAKRGED